MASAASKSGRSVDFSRRPAPEALAAATHWRTFFQGSGQSYGQVRWEIGTEWAALVRGDVILCDEAQLHSGFPRVGFRGGRRIVVPTSGGSWALLVVWVIDLVANLASGGDELVERRSVVFLEAVDQISEDRFCLIVPTELHQKEALLEKCVCELNAS
jgi:hypothetical protein